MIVKGKGLLKRKRVMRFRHNHLFMDATIVNLVYLDRVQNVLVGLVISLSQYKDTQYYVNICINT